MNIMTKKILDISLGSVVVGSLLVALAALAVGLYALAGSSTPSPVREGGGRAYYKLADDRKSYDIRMEQATGGTEGVTIHFAGCRVEKLETW